MTEEEIKGLQEEVEKLREEKQNLNGELTARKNRLAEMEQSIMAKDAEMAVLQQSFNNSVAGYRKLALHANPDVPAELIVGETIEAIDKAVEGAWTLVNKVREKLEKVRSRDSVPAGAPQRTPPDLSAMTPREKIQYGMGDKRGK